MKLPNIVKNISAIDGGFIALFLLYLILPIQTPVQLAPFIDTPFGMLVLFCITLYLFFFRNPLLGILYVFFAYELLRRTSSHMGIGNQGVRTSLIMQYTPSEATKETVLAKLNQPESSTLEEDVVSKMAPIGVSESNPILNSTFSPVAENIRGASLI